MQIVGVVDLRAGQAVRARGGRRDAYQPVVQIAGSAINAGDAAALARVYVDELGVSAIYVADLDAILEQKSQHEQIASISAAGVPMWVDAGVHTEAMAREAIAHNASRVVVGLETLRSFAELETICKAVEPEQVVFSLDLRGRSPITNRYAVDMNEPAQVIARRAFDNGARTLIVLDLERVGMRLGLDFEMLNDVRQAVPEATLFAGGSVKGLDDLAALAHLAYDGALVATALQDGLLSAADLARVQGWPQERDIR